jgi:hypothetical protein
MASATGIGIGWADLPADLLLRVIALLPFPGDRARICAACRAWRDAARRHDDVLQQPPWIVLPDCSLCTTGRDGAFYDRIPGGLPAENVTCLAAAAQGWLALDCTDDAYRRTPTWDMYCPDTGTFTHYPRPDVKHTHTYMLHNPFSGVTVRLPELDAVVGHVTETFQIRKVLMRSTTDDVIAVTTNNRNCNVILCRPGKGTFVLPNFRVVDAAFVGDTVLYGITSGEELLAFHLGEDEDGRPNVTRFERVIVNPKAAYYEKYAWSWPDHIDGTSNNNGDHVVKVSSAGSNKEEGQQGDVMVSSACSKYEEDQQEEEEEDDDDWEEEDDDWEEEDQQEDNVLSDNEEGRARDGDEDPEVPYEAKDGTSTARYLVRSLSGDGLLLVRHQYVVPLNSGTYSSKVEVFKADTSTGKWVPITADEGLGERESLFLSRPFSKSARAHGDVEDGLVYYASHHLDDAFDTRSWTIRKMTFTWPWQRKLMCESSLTWLFPPELVI